MKNHVDDSADRPATTEQEIEVTPEMIEAGVIAARDWLGDGRQERSTNHIAFEFLVIEILRAAGLSCESVSHCES